MPGILFQQLPLDILLLIFEYLDYSSLVLSSLCRSLKAASDAYLRHHPTVHLITSQEDKNEEYGQRLITDFLEQLASNRLAALSVRKIVITILAKDLQHRYSLREQTRDRLNHATGFIPYLCQQAMGWSKTRGDVSRWLLLVPFMCGNLDTLTVSTQDDLGWLHFAQHLGQTQWPHNCLTHLNITWINTDIHRPLGLALASWYRRHDLQDIWLLISVPALKSIILNGLEQKNNLYAGIPDQAAIRTTYWPVELESFSLYQLSYERQHNGANNLLPSMPTKSPFAHDFVHLEALNLHNFSAPESWLPLLLCCFKSLRYLKISIDCDIIWRGRQSFPFDCRLLKIALHQLATIEELTINISIPKERPKWVEAAEQGRFSVGSLDQMQQLRVLNLPWFMWVPPQVPNTDSTTLWGAIDVRLPSKLEELTLGFCYSSQARFIAELITAAVPSQEPQILKRIVLLTADDFSFKQADFAHLVSETGSIEIVSEGSGPHDPTHSIVLRLKE